MDKQQNSEVIYVHPFTPMPEPIIIPISVPALINRLPFKIHGYFSDEITREIAINTKIIILDIHWYFSLFGASEFVKEIKKINTDVIFIAGGITSTLFADILTNKFGIDYIIRGDAEGVLPLLVKSLLNNKKGINNVPNLTGKNNFKTEWTYSLNQNEFDENNYYDIDFFPSLKKQVYNRHKINNENASTIFPFLVPFRGCPIDCINCAGNFTEQQRLFKRSYLVRSAAKVNEDLNLLNNTNNYSFVWCMHDFITLLPIEYAKQALSIKTNLNINYEFASFPEIEEISLLFSAFKGGNIYFSMDNMHTTSENLTDAEKFIKLIKFMQKDFKSFVPITNFSGLYLKNNPIYRKSLEKIVKEVNCRIIDVSIWWRDNPKPDKNGDASEEEFFKYYEISKKETLDKRMKLYKF